MVQSPYLGFSNLEISHLDTTGGEIWDLKLDLNRSLGTLSRTANTTHTSTKTTSHSTTMLIVTSYTRQAQLCTHQELLATSKLLDLPHNGALLGRVVHGADVGSETRAVGVVGDRDDDLDVVGGAASLELSARLKHVLDSRARV